MRDVPIIFSAPMIRALLEGRKTMTRRLAVQNVKTYPNGRKSPPVVVIARPSPWRRVMSSDRLWVRETWQKHHSYATLADNARRKGDCLYRATHGENNLPLRWRSPIHMPRWASRLTLAVEKTRVERLQDITDEDCRAEGVERIGNYEYAVRGPAGGWWHTCATPRDAFAWLWRKLHGAGAWDDNPEVVALTFAAHRNNVDAMKEAVR